jgi:hypothetical protein
MADLMQALLEVAADADSDLIAAPEARVLIGRGPKYHLTDLKDFPAPVSPGYGRSPAMYDRAQVLAWYAAVQNRRAAKAEAKADKREAARRERESARAATFRAEALSLIPLPSEFERNRSLMRDLFDEDQRTCAPAPCGHWRVLLSKAGASADGRDISPAMLAAERERDRQHHARTSLTVGHRAMEKPRPDNLRLSAQVPEPGKQGHKPPAITLHGFVREVYAVGA